MANTTNSTTAENWSPLWRSFLCGGPHQDSDSVKKYVYYITGDFKSALVFLSVFNFLICLPTVFCNLAVIMGFARNRGLRTPSNRLLLSVCTADILVGLLQEPIMASHLLIVSSGEHKCGLSNFLVFTVPVLIVVTVVTHAGISVERYASIHYHQYHERYFTKRNLTIFMMLIWIACPASYIIPFLAGAPIIGTRIVVAIILISLLISGCAYISIYKDSSYRHGKPKYHVQGAFIIRENVTKDRTLEEMSLFRRDVRLAAFYFKLYACMLTFYLLNLIKSVINSYESLSSNGHHLFHFFLDTFLFVNALVNPILMLVLSPEIRLGIIKVFKS